jgi:hypothetical protein
LARPLDLLKRNDAQDDAAWCEEESQDEADD